MRAKTKLEKMVMERLPKLRPLTEKKREWAEYSCFKHEAFSTTASRWCSDCGHHWADRNEIKTCICPHCGKKLEVVKSNQRSCYALNSYFTDIVTIEGFQVVRTFSIDKISTKGNETRYDFTNIIQIWIDGKGKETIVAQNRSMGYYNDFQKCSDLSIKKEDRYSYTNFHTYGNIYPKKDLTKKLRKRGLKDNLYGCNPSFLYRAILSNEPIYETLLKTKQYSLLNYIVSKSAKEMKDYMAAIKICVRNGYIVDDASMWIDYISSLIYFGKDIHNAKYVCPVDLKESHDIYQRRRANKQRKEMLQREMERHIAALREKKEAILNFYKEKEKFFGMRIQAKDFYIVPLESITQFYLEGKKMRHCVFANEYYKKQDALILSARNKDGKTIETIELNLNTLEIVQSRAVCNGTSKFHDKIKKVLNKNITLIKKRMTA